MGNVAGPFLAEVACCEPWATTAPPQGIPTNVKPQLCVRIIHGSLQDRVTL